MNQKDQPQGGKFPPTKYIAAAIRNLPRAGPDVEPQVVDIDAGPAEGRYRVRFVVRENPDRRLRKAWFWGVESVESIPVGEAGTEDKP